MATASGNNTNPEEASATSKQKKKAAPSGPQTLPSMKSGGLELVMLRNNFYRDNFRRLMIFCLVLLLIIIGMGSFIYYQETHKPTPKYFATTHDGKLIKLVPLNQPNLTTNALLQWAVEAATAAYTFNFVDYRKALQDVRGYFTNLGYQNFIKALQDSRNLEAVKSKKLVVSAVPTGAPVVLREGVTSSGLYAWQVQFPMLLTYQSASDLITQNITITMLISRVPTLESDKGIGIASFVVQEGVSK